MCTKCDGQGYLQKDIERVLAYDRCLFGTDVLLNAGYLLHPAAFWTYPRIRGHYVRENRLFSIEDAIR
jgi:N-acyl-D-amino-acid deacylase